MKLLLANLGLALTWAVATGQFTLMNFLVGFVLGYVILWFARGVMGPSHYFSKVPQVVSFALFYVRELILANLRVAYDVITPPYYMRPGVIAVPLDATTDSQIMLLANLITLTPGSLSVDLSPDHRTLYVHVMYIDEENIDAVRHKIKNNLERRVLQVLQ